MSETVKVEAEITAELFKQLKRQVDQGVYRNKDEAIMDGIRQILKHAEGLTGEEKAVIEDVRWGLIGRSATLGL